MQKTTKKSITQIQLGKVQTLDKKQTSQVKGGEDTIGIQDIVDG
jgi:hypothetical protein